MYTLILFNTFIHFLDWIGPQLAFLLKLQYLILVNLQVVAGGKKCCFRQQILLVTT